MDLDSVIIGGGGQTARPQILHVQQGALEMSEERVTRRHGEFRCFRFYSLQICLIHFPTAVMLSRFQISLI